jgi:DNA-3-methyladenine glycosylase
MGNQGFIYDTREFALKPWIFDEESRLASRISRPQITGMKRIVRRTEFQGRNTSVLARWLLGKVLVRTLATGERLESVITEVEAYHGERDLACHASKGRTPRTEVMYKAGGCWYVYLCYGVHEMLNLVTGPEDQPAAVLIRGVSAVSGPGRLTKRWQIGRTLNGAAVAPDSGLHVEDHGIKVPRGRIKAGPRIGVDYAGPVWAAKPWRFWVESGVGRGRRTPPSNTNE